MIIVNYLEPSGDVNTVQVHFFQSGNDILFTYNTKNPIDSDIRYVARNGIGDTVFSVSGIAAANAVVRLVERASVETEETTSMAKINTIWNRMRLVYPNIDSRVISMTDEIEKKAG